MSEKINFDDIEFREPIEEREPNYRDGYIRGIYRAKNIIDSKQKEIERLNNIIDELEKWVKEDKECFETQFYMGRCVNFQCILDKLQELKGSDKE